MAARGAAAVATLLAAAAPALAQVTSDSPLAPPPNGPRRVTPNHHILWGVTLHPSPGERPFRGMVEFKDGRIVAAQPVFESEPPPTEDETPARVHVLDGEHVYAAFIDPFVEAETPVAENQRGRHWNDQVTPRRNVLDGDGLPETDRATLRGMGFAAAAIVPENGIFAGTGAVVSLVRQPDDDSARVPDVYRDRLWQIVNFQTRGFRGYPSSHPGLVALVRQTLLDAAWQQHFYTGPSNALTPLEDRDTPLVFNTNHELELLLADDIASEMKRDAVLVGTGREFKWLDAVARAERPMIVPLAFRDAPDVGSEAAIQDVELEDMLEWEHAPTNPARLADAGVEIALTSGKLPRGQRFLPNLRKAVRSGLAEEDALAALTTTPAAMLGVAGELGSVESGLRANLLVASGPVFDDDTTIYDVWIDGRPHEVNDRPEDSPDNQSDNPSENGANDDADSDDADAEEPGEPFVMPESPGYPFGAYAVSEPPEQPRLLVVRGGTVWTQGPDGVIEDGQVEITRGEITYVGPRRRVPGRARVVDASGKHVTPGLIDAHSHTGLFRFGVNEGGQAITSEVRIADSLHPDDANFYRQLAGGVTTINSLHGSANPIGGQSMTHKLRWGVADSHGMRLDGATPGIKFALGENVKRSRSSRQTRYPATRMGVETIIRDRFIAAREYARAWNQFHDELDFGRAGLPEPIGADDLIGYYDDIAGIAGSGILPPRRDLELEALAEILDGRRLVHCHSYRQDEILMLARVAEEFGFTIGTYQHGLEVYKVAEVVQPVTLGASLFADWWGYKFEVYDAIPYDGSLLNEVGVNVSYNSDSNDLARRLNLEAAKGVKYSIDDRMGNRMTSDEEALAFVTINPAIQLGIDDRVGSLEEGKDGDLVIWSGEPLSTLALPESTYIEGRRYFSLEDDRAHRERIKNERQRLIAEINGEAQTDQEDDSDSADTRRAAADPTIGRE